jgi:UDP-N-acetylmuramoyl-L-alanyl-D-glutamate--2,6-diaminopimelate ligase
VSARLSELAGRHGGRVHGPGAVELLDVELDSRRVRPGALFAALPGGARDGAAFTAEALARGARAVLSDRALPCDAPQWVHPDARRVAGLAAAQVHGEPARGIACIGITGTNGKTTTAHLTGQLLARAGLRPAVLGTAGHRLADGVLLPAAHTTPDAPELQRLLERHRALGGDALVMEVSSHALAQERTAGIDYSVAVFTNLSRDHLDYHGGLDAYARVKARLFAGLSPSAAAVLNAEDSATGLMAEAARGRGARIYTYGTRASCDLRASIVATDLSWTELSLCGMGISDVRVRLPFPGRHNVENALAALAAALLAGASPAACIEGLGGLRPAPGRLEPVGVGKLGFSVYVDYAHTPDALERVLATLRAARPDARLLAVFGCGGDRDRGKRAPMGRAVGALADVAVLTSDNPRGEDPARIIDDVLAGLRGERARVIVEPDRRAAIQRAIGLARAGDVVLIAGKGHETEQVIGSTHHPFDDRQVALEVLQ